MTDQELVIRGLRVAPVADPTNEILQGIDLTVGKGQVHAIMGPNGSGKTTLAYALMGHPAYKVTGGEISFKGRDVLALSPDKRSRLGLFLAFQYPTAIPGLSVASFIRSALNAKLQGVDKTTDVDPTDPMRGGISMRDFRTKMREKMALLRMDEGFASRYVNEGFSGGEKKRLEMLQLAMLEPEIAILDETDSGLDIDALRIVAEGVNAMLSPDIGVLLITHYQRLLNYITPDVVHVLAQGRIVKSGGKELALELEEFGYGPILREAGLSIDAPDEALHVPQSPDEEPVEVGGAGRRPRMTLTSEPAKAIDPHALRADFPILRTTVHGKPLVYLDSASTSQKPQVVIDAVDEFYREYNANVHRGIYEIGERSTAAYEKARAQVARFIGASDAHEVIFTRNATEAINLVAYSWGRKSIGRGDVIVLTEMEHHANLVPWQLLVQEKDGDLEFIPITDDGVLRLDVFEVLLRLKPKLVAFTHVSNTLGTINPVEELTRMAHDAGALVLIDGAQAVPHVPVDVEAIGADFYAFSGHKMLAPTGSGALWARRELLESMPPFLAGGEMIREVHLRRSEWNDIPWKFEAGTPDVAAAIGLGAAADYLRGLGMDSVREHERELVAYALETLRPRRARHRAVRPARRPARRRRPVQPAGDPSPRRGPGARPVRHRCPCRTPLHDAAPRAARSRRHGARELQRLLDPRGHRRADERTQGSPARLRRLGSGELLHERRQLGELGLVVPADEIRVDAPALARAAQLVDQARDRADHRVGRLDDVVRFDLQTRRRAIGIGHALRCLAGVRRDRDRPDEPQHAQVELFEPRPGLVAHPVDPRIHASAATRRAVTRGPGADRPRRCRPRGRRSGGPVPSCRRR